MTLHHNVQHPSKSLGESAICFGLAIAVLAGSAFAIQWLFGLAF